jgi:hypothetical protein
MIVFLLVCHFPRCEWFEIPKLRLENILVYVAMKQMVKVNVVEYYTYQYITKTALFVKESCTIAGSKTFKVTMANNGTFSAESYLKSWTGTYSQLGS